MKQLLSFLESCRDKSVSQLRRQIKALPGSRKRRLQSDTRRVLKNSFDLESEVVDGAGRFLLAMQARASRVVKSLQRRNVRDRFVELPRRERLRFARQAGRFLRKSDLAADVGLRLAAARVLLATVPESLNEIELLLADFSRPLSYEAHFSLFVLTSWDLEHFSDDTRAKLLCLVEHYLMSVPRESGGGAFIGGDLLGGHWDQDLRAVEVLLRSLRTARHAAGRSGAIHGLAHALHWLPERDAKRVRGALKLAAKKDRSKRIRWKCKFELSGSGCAPKRRETTAAV